uniref:Homeobox domain-containing protein n=1 Tax=Kalanchoe fedtschenkoi TaxID=63787 RepID=A0A7N0VAH3_KALFE
MMVDQEADLGLSLSLNLTHNTQKQQHQNQLSSQKQAHQFHNVNLFHSFFNSAVQHRASWNPFSSDQTPIMRSGETRTSPKGIDVNRLPSSEDYTEDAGASSPNSAISSLSGKRSERDENNADHLDRAACSGSDEEDGDNSRKKLRLSKDQSAILEDKFKEHNTLNPKQKMALAKQLGLTPRQVEVWFQNRRARTKLKQTEVDCEFLKRCCENLTEENRRLQKEVQELRALKLSPQLYMPMAPPTTLTICPSCELVGAPRAEGRSQSHQAGVGLSNNNPWAGAGRPFDAIRPRS